MLINNSAISTDKCSEIEMWMATYLGHHIACACVRVQAWSSE